MQITDRGVNKLEQQIETSFAQLKELWSYSNQLSKAQKKKLVEALEQLSEMLQEWQDARGELDACNAELSTSRLALEVERRRYRELFEFAPDGYVVTDSQGVIWEANQAAAQLLGTRRDCLLNKPLTSFIAQIDRPYFQSKLINLSSSETIRDWEILIQPERTKSFAATLTVAPMRNNEHQVIGWRWLVKDITLRKEYETALIRECQSLEKQVEERTVQLKAANEELKKLNGELEQKVRDRTAELQKSLELQAMLKRITDRIRDSFDENEILQTAVRELVEVLGLAGADAALYDLDRQTSTISYEYTPALPSARGHVVAMASFSEAYQQLLQNQHFQFCTLVPSIRGEVAILACPMMDKQEVLGDLWLFKPPAEAFKEQEIFLAQQVAAQCAIAICQARLYQAGQLQVAQLEQLNSLKNEFISTVSHELRTPVSNMKMAIQMLGITLNKEQDLFAELAKPPAEQSKIARYFQILQNECEREINLINDLLDLQRLDMGMQNLVLTAVDLSEWIPNIVESFQVRAQRHSLSLEINIPSSIPNLICDRASLERVVSELLNNACKYTPPGEKITISAAYQLGVIKLTIANSGVEIPDVELNRIFERFYRIPKADPWKQGGTGLGLALVQKLVTYLKGTITVKSERNQTSFTVSFPINSEE